MSPMTRSVTLVFATLLTAACGSAPKLPHYGADVDTSHYAPNAPSLALTPTSWPCAGQAGVASALAGTTVAATCPAGLVTSSDFGKTWTISTAVPAGAKPSFPSADGSDLYVATTPAGSFGAVAFEVSHDHGQTFAPYGATLTGSVSAAAVVGKTVVAFTYSGANLYDVATSTGGTFTTAPAHMGALNLFERPTYVSGGVLVVDQPADLLLSTDGVTFHSQPDLAALKQAAQQKNQLLSVTGFWSDGATLVFTTVGGLYRSSDGGAHVSQVALPEDAEGPVWPTGGVTKVNGRLYVSGLSQLFYSDDDGVTFWGVHSSIAGQGIDWLNVYLSPFLATDGKSVLVITNDGTAYTGAFQ